MPSSPQRQQQQQKQKQDAHGSQDARRKRRCGCHLNSLGSLGYCVVVLGLTTYVIATEAQQFLKYLNLPWPRHSLPNLELNVHIGLVGAAAVLLFFFFGAAVFKIGNFANDGYRLGVQDGACSRDAPPLPGPAGGLVRGAWLHGGPTAPFLHLLVAHLLIVARLVIEAAAIKATFLSEGTVWWSELSRVLPQRERLSIFNLLATYAGTPTPATPGPVAMRYEASTSVTFQAMDITTRRDGEGGADGEEGVEEEDMWHIGEIPWGPFSPHFFNYLLAHLVYAGRYAGVFWGTNKALGLVFFFQLILNAAQSIFSINGFQVLYKVHVVGAEHVLPVFEGFLLPLPACVAVFTASQVMVLASGSIIYLYGFVKFNSFLSAEKEKYHILSKHGHQVSTPWSYWPHCWALTVLVAMTAAASPLVYDWTVVYRSSLDTSVLAATIATIAHLFLWILLWLALTLKSRWHFKLRVQISKTIVTSTHSIRLVNEVQLSRQIEDTEGPVMVIGAGKTYLLQEGSPKRSLMKLVMHTVTQKKARGEEEEIYWLRPKPPQGSSGSWHKRKQSPGVKHKVTFNDTPSTSRKRDSGRGQCPDVLGDLTESETSDSDGDYARLRDVSFPGPTRKLSNKVNAARQIIYVLQEEQAEETNAGGQAEVSQPEPESLSVGGDFPAPPPELTDPAHYPPPPSTPPPPLPAPPEACSPPPGPPAVPQHAPQMLQQQQQHHHQQQQQQQQHITQASQQQHHIQQQHHMHQQHQQVQHQLQQQQQQQQMQQHLQQQQHMQQQQQQQQMQQQQQLQQQQQHHLHSQHHQHPQQPPQVPQHMTQPHLQQQHLAQPHPQIHVLRGTSQESSPGRSGESNLAVGEVPRCSDSSSTASSVSPPDKRCDSGIHSQASYSSSSASHSKSGSSGSESCVPIPPAGPPRCSSVDDLCRTQPPPPPPEPTVKSLSLQRDTVPPTGKEAPPGKAGRLNIEVVGGGYGFLPPSKFVASEPVYSDASTPVVIKRRSSVTAVEPDTPPYERSGSSFSTFTEPQLPRAVLKGNPYPAAKSQTVAAHGLRARRLPAADAKHATIAGVVPPKGFHQPGHIDSRYFSVPAVKPPADAPVRL
ncbi:protein tincar-like isoform X3 [Portunus trituberculatus]|uniref:protein tincar-like isoform X3 n=1 Tax=Portunus trituberculatus TaxID=210409 RepID=UPI001E1D1B55|nr:protein tincar-like isoform X3 [Portunus trituberculatus]